MRISTTILAGCLALGGATSCDITCRTPDYVGFNTFTTDLYVGDRLTLVASAESMNEFCTGPLPNSTERPAVYSMKTTDSAVAVVSTSAELTAVGAGIADIVASWGQVSGKARVFVARPIARLEFVVTPASPKVGDTVTVVTRAVDYDGQVTPGASFSGLNATAVPAPGGFGAVLLFDSASRIRLVIKSAGRYTVTNMATHRGYTAATGQVVIDVP